MVIGTPEVGGKRAGRAECEVRMIALHVGCAYHRHQAESFWLANLPRVGHARFLEPAMGCFGLSDPMLVLLEVAL